MNELNREKRNVEDKAEDIKEIIDTLRMYIQNDGGDVEFVSVEHNVVTVKLLGACVGCGFTGITYEEGLQSILRDEVDSDIEVKLITESNPFVLIPEEDSLELITEENPLK